MAAEANYLQVHSKPDVSARLARLQTRASGRFKLGLSSRSMRYGLRRDLNATLETPSAKIPISVRPMVEADLARLLDTEHPLIDNREKLEIAWRKTFVDKGAKGGFVAVDLRSDTPCYMQWLMGSAQNGFIKRLGSFPELEAGEALLENAYTPVPYRGMGIMSAAMAMIAERAADIEARYVLTFVDQHNVPSLKGCQRAGFYPHMLHHQVQKGFGLLKRNTFERLREDDPRRNLRF